MTPKVPCPKCAGSGSAPLDRRLAETLALFRDGELSAMDCAAAFPEMGATAQNNRLRKLFDMGLLDRRKAGKAWMYSLK